MVLIHIPYYYSRYTECNGSVTAMCTAQVGYRWCMFADAERTRIYRVLHRTTGAWNDTPQVTWKVTGL